MQNINIDGYRVLNILHQGNRSIINRAIRKKDKHHVIIKVLSNETPTDNDIRRINREYELARRIHHDNIIRFYTLESYGNAYAIIEEDFNAVSLLEIIPAKGLDIDVFLQGI